MMTYIIGLIVGRDTITLGETGAKKPPALPPTVRARLIVYSYNRPGPRIRRIIAFVKITVACGLWLDNCIH